MPNRTKKELAASLKRLLCQKPLDKITIQDLVNDAQVSRKTFYYHFQDIYSLLEWALVDEGRQVLADRDQAGDWRKRMWDTFRYFQDNQAMILNIYRSVQKNRDLLERHVSGLILPLLDQLFGSQPGHERVEEEDKRFLLDLYSYGLVQLFLRWIGDGMKADPQQMMARIDRLFTGSMEDFIRRCAAP